MASQEEDWRPDTKSRRKDAESIVKTRLERYGGVEGRRDYLNDEFKAALEGSVALEHRLRADLSQDLREIERKRKATEKDHNKVAKVKEVDIAGLRLSEALHNSIDRMVALIGAKEYGIKGVISMLKEKGYSLALKVDGHAVDVNWRVPENIRRLFRGCRIDAGWQPSTNSQWDQNGLYKLLESQIEAYEDELRRKEKVIDDLKDHLADVQQNICEESTTQNSREFTREAEGANDQGKISTPEDTGAEEDELIDDNPDRELLYSNDPGGMVQPVTALRRARDTLHGKLQATEVSLENLKAADLGHCKTLLRHLVYGPDDLKVKIREACGKVLNEDQTQRKALKLYDRMPAVAFFTEFEPMLAKRKQGKWLEQPFRIMLALIAGVDRPETLSEIELYCQLAWLNTGIHRVREATLQYELNALDSYMRELNVLPLTGMSATLRTMVVANLSQRGGPNNSYFSVLNSTLENHHSSGDYPLALWTVIEKIAFIWLCVVAGQWPSWLSEDVSTPYDNMESLQACFSKQWPSCRDFVDVLLLCDAYIEHEQDGDVYKFESDAKEGHIMVILAFTGDMGESVEYIWVRDEEGDVCFWENGAGICLRAIDDTYFNRVGWMVQLASASKTTAWFPVRDASALKFFENCHKEQVLEAVNHFCELN